ncbi:hypothetical protein [Schleiferilactobacillus perolens]|jgi:hypothetical protein|uniref:hypothetical protein n=1 Tax=Schleiferilactobacillus perolens TaxID=100468 RepID=UPI00235755B4|nr:hypothetical protein [Schleiferilactobacillus perolens]MCI1891885.1 hypothetical protein [Schleiferilactobacillus harbinensis]MCI1911609.1 hypothetical protein [Schleiferilactobacillus harbinensis]MCI2170321.1 hypothetical protein [Schleiferilactobacillus perolens]
MTQYQLHTAAGQDVAVDVTVQDNSILLKIDDNSFTWTITDAGKAFLASPTENIWPGGEGGSAPIPANAIGRAALEEYSHQSGRRVVCGETETVSQYVDRGNTAGVMPVQIRAYRCTDEDIFHIHFFREDETDHHNYSMYRDLPQSLVGQLMAADRLFAIDFTDKVRAAIFGRTLGEFLTNLTMLQPGQPK